MLARLAFVLGVVVIGGHADLYCYDDVKSECASNTYQAVCSTTFGNFPNVVNKFQQYANAHLSRSIQALMVGKHFSNYELMRPGFHSLFMSTSDKLFDKFISLMRYINDRGSTHDFTKLSVHDETHGNYELYELESLSLLTDMVKKLAQGALDLDSLVGGTDPRYHDSDSSYHLENYHAHRYRIALKCLASYYVKLEMMLTSKNQMLVMYDFDDHLFDIFGDEDDD